MQKQEHLETSSPPTTATTANTTQHQHHHHPRTTVASYYINSFAFTSVRWLDFGGGGRGGGGDTPIYMRKEARKFGGCKFQGFYYDLGGIYILYSLILGIWLRGNIHAVTRFFQFGVYPNSQLTRTSYFHRTFQLSSQTQSLFPYRGWKLSSQTHSLFPYRGWKLSSRTHSLFPYRGWKSGENNTGNRLEMEKPVSLSKSFRYPEFQLIERILFMKPLRIDIHVTCGFLSLICGASRSLQEAKYLMHSKICC